VTDWRPQVLLHRGEAHPQRLGEPAREAVLRKETQMIIPRFEVQSYTEKAPTEDRPYPVDTEIWMFDLEEELNHPRHAKQKLVCVVNGSNGYTLIWENPQ